MTREEFEKLTRAMRSDSFNAGRYTENQDHGRADACWDLGKDAEKKLLSEFDRLTAQLAEANAIIMDVANQECTYRDQLDSKCESTYEGLLEYLRKIGEVKGINGRMYKWAKKQC